MKMDKAVIYGIPNCDSVKKTISWFKANKLEFSFHDFKKSGITKHKLSEWCKYAGWETVLNKKGTTWRGLTAEDQEKIKNQSSAIALMIEKTSSIKRPVVEFGDNLLIGFNDEKFAEAFL